MYVSRGRLFRWFLPLLAVVFAGITLIFVGGDPNDQFTLALFEGAFALVLAGGVFAVGYRYVATAELSQADARTVALWTLAGVGLLATVNVWFRTLGSVTGEIEPHFAAVTSLTAGALGGAVVGISMARARRRHAEREHALANYREIFETVEDAIVVHDAESFDIVDANPRAVDLFGYTVTELREMDVVDFTPDRAGFDEETARAKLEQALDGGLDRFEWPIERKDGSQRWVECSLKRTTLGTDLRLIALVRDISDRKEYERELAIRSKAMEASIDGIAILDDDEEYRFVNRAHADVYGYEDPEAMIGETWRVCYGEDELARFEEEVMPTLFEEGGWRGEATGTREDGTTFPQELSLSVTDGGGIVCVARDITERKKHERHIVDLHDATREMVQANDERDVCEIAVRTAEQLLEFPLTAIWLADEGDERLEPAAATDTAGELFGDLPVYTEENSVSWRAYATGETLVFDDLGSDPELYNPDSPVRSELVVPLGEFGVLNTGATEADAFTENDVALAKLLAANTQVALERVERERELERQTDQMEFFNSILRHDVLNGIMVIKSRAEFLEENLDGDQLRDAETIVRWSNDVVEIVQRVRTVLEALTSGGEARLEPVDLETALRGEVERIRSTCPDVTFDTAIPDDAAVLANGLLDEVLGNVVTNAVEHNDTDDLRVSITAEEGDEFVAVRIADDGRGVVDDRKEAVFRRGETGRAKSTESGFGLFFVDAMVSKYGGDVRIEDNEEGGATFVIRLPPADRVAVT